MKLLSAVTSAVLVAAAAVLPAAAASPSRTAPASAHAVATQTSIHWGPCTDPSLRHAHAQCGTVRAPLDYARPHGAQVSLAVSRIRHTVAASAYLGPILVNPGGPGGSGLVLATLGFAVPHKVGARYDWIGFDPRGVGASRPRLRCDDSITRYDRPDYRATTAALESYWLHRSKTYARACARDDLPLLQNITTADSARDLDTIRVALGVRKISYYGYSYGTYLGQVYATLFPTHIRRMVLDSNVDPRGVWYQDNLSQDIAFQITVRRFFGWLAHYDTTFHLGSTEHAVEAGYDAEYQKLKAHPAQGRIGPDELTDFVSQAAYYQSAWPFVALGYQALVQHGKVAGVFGVGPADDNEYAVYDAVECTDAAAPASYATWRADALRYNRRAPFLTWDNVWFNAPCLYWPVPGGTPVTIDGSSAPPTLLVDQTLDPATPYAGSLEVRRLFPRSRLLALPGGVSHATSLEGDPCEDNTIAAYLATGALPTRKSGSRADTTCAPPPSPRPFIPGGPAPSPALQAIAGLS